MTERLERLDGESALQHHRRLIYGKLEDKTLADIDYAELSEQVYGQPYSSDVARRMMYGSKKTLDLIAQDAERVLAEIAAEEEAGEQNDEVFANCKQLNQDDGDAAGAESSISADSWTCGTVTVHSERSKNEIGQAAGKALLDDLDARRIAFEKEKQKFYDQRAAYNKMIRDRAREEELNDIIRECVSSGVLPELRYDGDNIGYGDKTLLVSLNDIHYGAQIDNAWCRYNSDICAEMMRDYLAYIMTIARTHECSECVVWAAGDMISGNIHRSIQVTNKENVIAQIMGVSELIAQFLAELSGQFETVRFVSVAGNHSRIEPNKDNAITAERLDNLIEWYLAARLQNFRNVIITNDRLDDTICLFQVRGKNYALVHGDFDGSAGKIQSLQQMIRKPLYAVLSGHMHHNQTNVVQGVRTIMAGSFQGMDQFCVEKRIVGEPEQIVCVCDEEGILCHYDIPLK